MMDKPFKIYIGLAKKYVRDFRIVFSNIFWKNSNFLANPINNP